VTAHPIHIRDLDRDDESERNFVLSAWKRGYRGEAAEVPHEHGPGCPVLACMDRGAYYRLMEARLVPVLERASVVVACNPTRESQLYGFAAGDRDALHYVYVKAVFRGRGFARRLVERVMRDPSARRDPPMPVTHWTHAAERYAVSHPGEIVFVPSLLVGDEAA